MTYTTDQAIKFGVAGNMAGHLEQAGEASDFVAVKATTGRPKGLFPWHVPGAPGVLGVDPVSGDALVIPAGEQRIQQEPEVALLCELVWQDDRVSAVVPKAFAAYNDASIRKEAPKIRFKKHWGAASKGLGPWHALDGLHPGGTLDSWRLASFVTRDGVTHPYGEDCSVPDYETFHADLLDWMADKLNAQQDEGPLEDIPAWLAFAGRPTQAVFGIGATRYTAFGRQERLRPRDVSVVVVYDGEVHTPEAVAAAVASDSALTAASVLRQVVRESEDA